MRTLQNGRIPAVPALALCSLLILGLPAAAQTTDPPPPVEDSAPAPEATPKPVQTAPTSGSDRLFLAFSKEATVVDSQWWEGQLDVASGEQLDSIVGRLIFALQPLYKLEVGGRVGFGSTSTLAPLPDGSGATDLDAWIKYRMGKPTARTEWAIGGELTLPTGDDTAGLGSDAFRVGLFASVRHSLARVLLSGYLGASFNQDGSTLGIPLNGKVSGEIGAGVLAPLSDEIALVGELVYESARFDSVQGLDYDGSDARLLGGVNWRVSNRGIIRGALVFGLASGSPDFQFLGGYAFTF